MRLLILALLTLGIASCGGDTTGNRLHGRWMVDWAKTIAQVAAEETREVAADTMKALVVDFEMEFAEDTVRVRITGTETESPWSVAAREGDIWKIRGRQGVLTIEWIGDENEIAYETTYTVVLQPDGRWLVDSVEATPLSEVP